jgi:AAT family amino acid transporter
MPLFPIAQITGIALLAAILVTMGLDTEFWNISWIVGVPWLVAISLVYFFYRKRLAQSVGADAPNAANA